MSRRLGLIIGVNHSQDPTFRQLQFAENDARALAQWLVNTRGGKWSPGDVQLVQGRHATQELIQPLISQICLQVAEADDLVLIYFAGHAFLDERTGDSYLVLSNTSYQEPSSGLRLSSFITQVMVRSRAAHVLLILDCFQTGPLWRAQRTSPYDSRPLMGERLISTLQQQTNRFLLTTCRGNETASETGERQLGLFAHRTIVGLCGPAGDPSTATITLQQLHSYLYNTLGEQQRPHLFGRIQSPMVLIGEMPSAPQPSSTPIPEHSPQPFSTSTPSNAAPFAPQFSASNNQRSTHMAATAQLSPNPADPTTSGLYSQQQPSQLLEQARQLLQAQNYPEAINSVEQALQIAPNEPSALTLKGQILGSMGRFQEALAVVDQLGQANPNNPLAWSMRAVLLSNTGQHQAALAAIERSLELNPGDPETYAIKTNIMATLANTQGKGQSPQPLLPPADNEKKGGPLSFVIGAILQIAGFLIGSIGMALPILRPGVPVFIGFAIASFGLALLCVNSFRGAYRYGFLRLLLTLAVSLVAGGFLAMAYKFGYTRIVNMVTAPTAVATQPPLIVSVILFGVWLIAAAIIPFLLAIVGFITGMMRRRWRKRRS
jgi:tetratricopeptide (TPR) repeat protein